MKQTPTEIRDAGRIVLVDEYGHLLEKMAPHKRNFARLAEVAKGIRSWYAESAGHKSYVAQGETYLCTVSACESQSHISDMQMVYDRLGHKKFLAACSISLKAMAEAGLNVGDIAALTHKAATGSRSLDVTKRDLALFAS